MNGSRVVVAWLAAWLSVTQAADLEAQERQSLLARPSTPFPAAGTDAARRRIDVDIDSASLTSALDLIARSAGLRFTYSPDLLERVRSVSLQAEGIPVVDALRRLLAGTGLDVEVSPGGDATIFPARSKSAAPAEGTVNGRVTDAETGRPLGGVRVGIEAIQRVATSGTDGRFILSAVPDGRHQLRATLLGYASAQQAVTVTGNAVVTVEFALQPEAIDLEELVVVGYGNQERRDLTGSIASVRGEAVSAQPVPSVSAALQGRAAGLHVISSGVPGSDATFRIRGISTIGNSAPLVVIDGIPTTSGLNQINPADIASIEVLKDASAAAIYGARGANGVVIITTRTGGAGGGGMRLGAYQGYQRVTQMVELLDATEFARLHNEMMANSGLPGNPAFADPARLGPGTDWLNEFIDVARMQNYSASYAGGTDGSKLYLSGSLLRQDGVIRNTGFDRFTIQLNGDVRVREGLTLGNKFTLNRESSGSGSYNIQAAMGAQPSQAVFDADGSYAGPVGRSEWVGDIVNPIGQAELIRNTSTGYNLIGSIFADLQWTETLSLRANLGLQANFWNGRTWSPAYDWQPNPQEDSYLFEQYNRSTTWLVENTATYAPRLSGAHELKLLAGTSLQANDYAFMNGSVQGFPSDRAQELANGVKPPTLDGNQSDWALVSYIGRVNYAYDDTYLLTATLRRDGSSRFGSGNRWGWFPSVAAAWRISNLSPLADAALVDDLKLRVGYGSTGNQEIGNYAFASALQTTQYSFGGGVVNGVVPSVMPNPAVRWESVEQFNLGLDASLLDDRIRLTLDGYVKNTGGMLVPMSVPVTTGYSDIVTPYINAGSIRNRGVELSLSTDNLRGRVAWTTDLNLSFNRNEVISLNDTIPMPVGWIDFNYQVGRIQAGQPINAFYGHRTDGIFQSEQEVADHATQVPGADPFNRTSPGDVRFRDLNGDGIVNDADRTFIGNPNPDVVFGINNSVSYGPFDLHVAVSGVLGNEIFNANRIWTEGMSSARNQTTATLGRWTGPGSSHVVPRAVFGDPNGNSRASDRYVEDGSYLRLRNVNVGFSLPDGVTRTLHAGNMRMYVSAQNLWTLTGYSGFDPEVGIGGIDNNVYPVTRTFSIGVDVAL